MFTGCLHAVFKATLHLLAKYFSLPQCLPPGDPRNPYARRAKERGHGKRQLIHWFLSLVSSIWVFGRFVFARRDMSDKTRAEMSLANVISASSPRLSTKAAVICGYISLKGTWCQDIYAENWPEIIYNTTKKNPQTSSSAWIKYCLFWISLPARRLCYLTL